MNNKDSIPSLLGGNASLEMVLELTAVLGEPNVVVLKSVSESLIDWIHARILSWTDPLVTDLAPTNPREHYIALSLWCQLWQSLLWGSGSQWDRRQWQHNPCLLWLSQSHHYIPLSTVLWSKAESRIEQNKTRIVAMNTKEKQAMSKESNHSGSLPRFKSSLRCSSFSPPTVVCAGHRGRVVWCQILDVNMVLMIAAIEQRSILYDLSICKQVLTWWTYPKTGVNDIFIPATMVPILVTPNERR